MPQEPRDEDIDLNKISQRALLQLLYSKVLSMEAELKVYTEKYVRLLIKVNTLETRVAMYAAIAGGATAAFVEIGIYIITQTK
jgi:hypothetical protein